MWYWDLENAEHEWMSASFWTTLGYDPSEKQHLASEWQDIIHPDDLKTAYDNFQKHCQDPSHPYNQVVRYRHKDGSTVWIRCRGLAIRNDEGKPIRMIGAHTDITDVKSKEERLEKTIKMRDQFFARMSHEIRTPLFGLVGTAETLLEQVTDPDIREKLTTMTDCGHQLQALLNDILTLSRLNEDKLLLSQEVVRFSEITKYLRDLYKLSGQKKGVTLSIVDVPADLYLFTDRVRLTQVLSNLLSNAMKYTKAGHVSVSIEVIDGMAHITVADTGIGIKNVENVLAAYGQEDTSYEGLVGGTGLGLDIVMKLCALLGHEFSMSSELGKGTKATVKVKVDEGAPSFDGSTPELDDTTHSTAENISALSVLVVDDNDINREIVNAMLDGVVLKLEFAENGAIAVDNVVVQKRHYDVILMDINMPIRNGYEATREIRAATLPLQPYIIALSADAFDSTLSKCNEVGMNTHMAKPFTKANLIKVLEMVVSALE